MAIKQFRLIEIKPLIAASLLQKVQSNIWGFADQGLISATNFITMVLLARQLGPKGFGVFVLAYTVLLFTNSVQSALFTAPHNVLGATRTGQDYADYTTATFRMQAVFSVIAGIVISITGVVAIFVGRGIGWIVIAIGLATVTWQLQEFCRRVLYTQSDFRTAFTNDLITYGGQTLGIMLLWQFGYLTAPLAVLSIANASMIGFCAGVVSLRKVLFAQITWSKLRWHSMENWRFGGWLLGSNITFWLSGQLYPMLTAGFVGLGVAGGMRATQLLTAPTTVVQQTLTNILPSPLARRYHMDGFRGLVRYSVRFGVFLIAIIGVYGVLVCLLAAHIVPLVFGGSYAKYTWLVYVFAAFSVLSAGDMIAFNILKSAGITRPAFLGSAASAVFTLTVGLLLVAHFGLVGAMIGRTADLVIRNLVLWSNVLGAYSAADDSVTWRIDPKCLCGEG